MTAQPKSSLQAYLQIIFLVYIICKDRCSGIILQPARLKYALRMITFAQGTQYNTEGNLKFNPVT